jgi:hypothetical protein
LPTRTAPIGMPIFLSACVKYFTQALPHCRKVTQLGIIFGWGSMTIRQVVEAGRQARLEAENARLRKLAADLAAADIGELQAALGARPREGAIDPAHRLLVVSGGERGTR